MEGIKITLEFNASIEVLKQVLIDRGFEPSIANMKKIAAIYKERRYNISDKKFFEDIPKDKDILLMYGMKPLKK